MNEESFESELRNTFLSETEEMLEDTESIFMQIELSPDDLSKMDKVLRIVHTIKGSGAVVGFNEVAHFTHKFETLLVAVRDKLVIASAEVVDLLLASNDCLKHCVALLKKDHKAILHILKKTEVQLEEVLKKNLSQSSCAEAVSSVETEKSNKQQDESISSIPETTTSSKDSHKTKGTILVCDDEEDILDSLNQILTYDNYTVITSNKASMALEILKNESIDIILTDLAMPGMNGLELAMKIRKINNYIPIIFISGNVSREHMKKFLEIGVNDFLDKPFTVEQILLVTDKAMYSRFLWNELLTISKACFKTFVYVQKLETFFLQASNNLETHKFDNQLLKNCLSEIQQSTKNLLRIEKRHKETVIKNIEDNEDK